MPIIGASGDGGENYTAQGNGFTYPPVICSGAGGGGAITMASSSSITVSGSIKADSGSGCQTSGAAGAIRIVANAINVSTGVAPNFSASIVRLEAPTGAVTYTGYGTPPVIATINPEITPSHPPLIDIDSVGGYQVPSYSGSSFTTIDLLLPTQLRDPIPVHVHATNVPVGSSVTVSFSGSNGATSTTAPLSGSNASSTATVNVSGLNRSSVTYLFASVTFDASLISANLPQSGPDAVSKIQLATAPAKKTTYRFFRRDGSEISSRNIPSELRYALGF